MLRLFICIYICTILVICIRTCTSAFSACVRVHKRSLQMYIHIHTSTNTIFMYLFCHHLGCLTHWMLTPIYIYTLSSRSCTPQTRSCPSRLTAIIANRRYRCTSSGTVRKSSSRVKASRSQAQGRTLRLFGTDLMRDAIIRRRSPRVILLSYPLYHKNTIRISPNGENREYRQIDVSRAYVLCFDKATDENVSE